VPEVTGPAEDDEVPVSHKDRRPAPAEVLTSVAVDVVAEPAAPVGTPKKQAAVANGQKKAKVAAAAAPKPHAAFFDDTIFCTADSLVELRQKIQNEDIPGIDKGQVAIYQIEEPWKAFLTDLECEPELSVLIGYQMSDLKAAHVLGQQVTA